MALTTYSGLATFMERILNRSDQTAYFPDFLSMAEAHFNREIRVPQMEASVTATTDIATVALPTDFLEAREVFIDAAEDTVLIAMTPSFLRGHYAADTAGSPEAYAVSGQELILAPAPSEEVTVGLAYYQKIPALTVAEPTNWLLSDHPDLYVWAIRYYAAEDQMDVELAGRCLANIGGLIDSVNRDGNKRRNPAGPITMRSGVSE